MFCIVDVTIGFDLAAYNVIENGRFVNVTVVLTGRTQDNISFVLSTNDGSAVCEYNQGWMC